MKASDYIAKFLTQQGVKCVFEMSGGMITHMLDSMYRLGGPQIISTHHEQAAAFAADAVGRITGVPGVAMATSGPGATNLLTGIGSCYFDSSPAVFITGQVNRSEQKGERQIRQLGFQETDIVSMAKPITKAAWQVHHESEVPELLAKAFALATTGRPGPVLLDIPMDLQRADIAEPREVANRPPQSAPADAIDEATWIELVDALNAAQRPLILAGGGVQAARAFGDFREFVRKVGVPVVNSLMAVDVLPYEDPLRVGMIGSYGKRWVNLAVGRSDFLLVLGSRLDVRQTGSETGAFKAGRVIFHIDCESGEINNRVVGCRAVISELSGFLQAANQRFKRQDFPERAEWLAEIAGLRRQWPDTSELADVSGINPNEFLHRLSGKSQQAAAYVVDVGQHQMWAAQSVELLPEQRFLTSGGMGSMGFALPAAIGTAFCDTSRPVVLIAGDGGFQSNIQELETVVRNQLPIKMVIINNNCHGMVRQFQESYFDERYQSTLWGYSAPDFARVATAYGVATRTVKDDNEVAAALSWLWESPSQPALLQVMVNTFANALPKIAFGRPITEMEPFAKPLEMEGT
jgi:acetolactate synthase I/II/III large subunit